jgi:hypothetical protein
MADKKEINVPFESSQQSEHITEYRKYKLRGQPKLGTVQMQGMVFFVGRLMNYCS